jgi:hypothetical protein
MNRSKTSKKRNATAEGIHWHFDEAYSLAEGDEFAGEKADDMIRRTFDVGNREF